MKRSGLTLLEVLISIFIMGIGMLSVLALFPVAASMMGTALQNYRVSEGVQLSENVADSDVVDFVKNEPWTIYKTPNIPLFGNTTVADPNREPFFSPLVGDASPRFFILDQYAAQAGKSTLNGNGADRITVGYINKILKQIDYPDLSKATRANIQLTKTGPYIGGYSLIPQAPAIVDVGPSDIMERFFTVNNDVDLDDSGSAINLIASPVPITVPTRNSRFTLAYFLAKSDVFSPYPTKKFLMVYSGRDLSLPPDFVRDTASIDPSLNPNAMTVSSGSDYRRGEWLLAFKQLAANTYPVGISFHKILNVTENSTSTDLEVSPKIALDFQLNPPIPSNINIFLLKDVVRVVDLGN